MRPVTVFIISLSIEIGLCGAISHAKASEPMATLAVAAERQCLWFPDTCKDGKPVLEVDPTCLEEAVCDENGQEYTEEEIYSKDLQDICDRYVEQHGYGQDFVCGE